MVEAHSWRAMAAHWGAHATERLPPPYDAQHTSVPMQSPWLAQAICTPPSGHEAAHDPTGKPPVPVV